LALTGGVVGVVLAALCVYLFRALLVSGLGFPFLFPSFGMLAALAAAGLAAALFVVSAAALLPVLRISRQDPADSMRE
jgi:ABC-type antimicrobial peptide transport system permease subunit